MFLKITMAASLLLMSPVWAQAQVENAVSSTYTRDTPVEKLAADPAAAAVLNKDLPGLLADPQYPFFKAMSLKALHDASGGDLSDADLDRTVADLQALPPH